LGATAPPKKLKFGQIQPNNIRNGPNKPAGFLELPHWRINYLCGMDKKRFKRYTVTAALPYANGPLHIGHLAGAYLPSDIYCRYLRSQGEDVVYICGTDEHGTAIAIKALQEGTTPQEIVDRYHVLIKDTFEKFNISFDHFSRTSNPIHHQTAQEFFLKFVGTDNFQEEVSKQPYDAVKGVFLADRFITGTCPNCQNERAYGNQCEKCGKDLSPAELINPRSTLSDSIPVWKETKHWYLRLNKYQDWLKTYILDNHSEWKTNVLGQCKAWLQEDLKPRAITRDLDWGVKVPLPGAEDKVLYVWFDAPIGYISATKEWAALHQTDWRPYWQDEDTKLVHFIGKDNIVFHCIIFPCILKGHGDYIVPDNVPANEFLNLEGEKISTSRDWAVWMHQYLEDFPGKVDVLRYVLTSIMPETKDADFTWADFQIRNNKELVDTFANFINRVKVLTLKNFESVPAKLARREEEIVLQEAIYACVQKAQGCIENYRFKEALNEVMEIARLGDRYLSTNEPWHLIKSDKALAGHVLNVGLNIASVLAVVCEPFMPDTSSSIFKMLGIHPLKWNELNGLDMVASGGVLHDIPHLFSRIENNAIEAQVERLKNRKASMEAQEPTAKPFKSHTSFDQFQQMDIRIGTILAVEKVEKSKKLLKLLVDLGLEKRVILSGVAEHFEPDDLVGKQCTVLVNLPPRAMMGIESNGMVLFAEDNQGKLHLLNPGNHIDNGSTVN
jgi:methionyl-tRNA synthetase